MWRGGGGAAGHKTKVVLRPTAKPFELRGRRARNAAADHCMMTARAPPTSNPTLTASGWPSERSHRFTASRATQAQTRRKHLRQVGVNFRIPFALGHVVVALLVHSRNRSDVMDFDDVTFLRNTAPLASRHRHKVKPRFRQGVPFQVSQRSRELEVWRL